MPTLLLRLAQLSSARGAVLQNLADSGATSTATNSLALCLECLRLGRLAGDVKKEDADTVSSVIGQEHKTTALAHKHFKKQDPVVFVFHEAWLVNESLVQAVAPFRTPLGIWQKFQIPVGEQSLVAAICKRCLGPWRGAGEPVRFARCRIP